MSIEPRYLSADMDNAPIHLVDDEYRLQESLRVMSSDPHEPRIFSQERIFVPVFLSLGSGMTWAMVSMLLSDSEGSGTASQDGFTSHSSSELLICCCPMACGADLASTTD